MSTKKVFIELLTFHETNHTLAFYNLSELTVLSLADNANLFFIDADAFVQCENFQQLGTSLST